MSCEQTLILKNLSRKKHWFTKIGGHMFFFGKLSAWAKSLINIILVEGENLGPANFRLPAFGNSQLVL